MKLQQLKFLTAIAQSGLNITAAAAKLNASQPAISRQLRLLESELGFDIFAREGRTLTKITPAGQKVIERALRILHETRVIKDICADLRAEKHGTLAIGTTHTQARYVLPSVVKPFRERYPEVDLHLHQGTSEQLAELAQLDRIDLVIATGSRDLFPQLALLPCYQWHHRLIVPKSHPLARARKPTLAEVAAFPVITYAFSLAGRSSLHEVFSAAGLALDVALTARDADVIKTYVRVGLGVGIIADVACDPENDRDLVSSDMTHVFPAQTTWAGFIRGGRLRSYTYDFLQMFASHLTRELVERASNAKNQQETDALFADIPIPSRVS